MTSPLDRNSSSYPIKQHEPIPSGHPIKLQTPTLKVLTQEGIGQSNALGKKSSLPETVINSAALLRAIAGIKM